MSVCVQVITSRVRVTALLSVTQRLYQYVNENSNRDTEHLAVLPLQVHTAFAAIDPMEASKVFDDHSFSSRVHYVIVTTTVYVSKCCHLSSLGTGQLDSDSYYTSGHTMSAAVVASNRAQLRTVRHLGNARGASAFSYSMATSIKRVTPPTRVPVFVCSDLYRVTPDWQSTQLLPNAKRTPNPKHSFKSSSLGLSFPPYSAPVSAVPYPTLPTVVTHPLLLVPLFMLSVIGERRLYG